MLAQNERACHEGQSSFDKVPTFIPVAALRLIGDPFPGVFAAHDARFAPKSADTSRSRHFSLVTSAASEAGDALIASVSPPSDDFRPLRGPPQHDTLPLVTLSLTLGLLGRPGRRNGGLIRHCRDGDALDRRWHGELRQLLRLDVPRFATTRYENVPDTESAFFPFATRVAASASTVNPAAERFAMDLDI